MNPLRPKALPILLVCAVALTAAPVITSVQNAASNLTPALPNASLAPGSIFVIKGTGLGPDNIAIAPAPFQSTTLAGTSVSLTVSGTTVNALLYYTSATQIAALLPSNTPTGGPGTITVTYNGQSNPTTQFRGVTANNLGIFTLDSTGQGVAIVTYPDYSLVSALPGTPCGGPYTACGSANPGDTLILWATGLGGITGSDASGAGLGQNMPDIPLTLWLGGVQAPVIYQGRSGCCIGEDQIVFRVPDNVPTGCAVPLVVQIRNQVSNSTVMPVAQGGRTCPSNDLGGNADLLPSFLSDASLSLGDIGLQRGFNNNGSGFRDTIYFGFYKLVGRADLVPFFPSLFDSSPPGTCLVHDNSNPGDEAFGIVNFEALNGGSSFNVRGPGGSMNVAANGGDEVTLSASGTFLGTGAYTVTGNGGANVGPFSVTVDIPPLPTLTSPSGPAGLTVTRSNGLTVSWTGGVSGNVVIEVTGAPDQFPTIQARASCKALASAGTLTIPSFVLLALPPGNAGTLYFGTTGARSTFTATGIELGSVHVSLARAGFGTFAIR
jgi:uncharacterized protein (TIGR03437 family)